VHTGYASLAGNELINSSRAAAYSSALAITTVQCSPCATLPRALRDGQYVDPGSDDAPWFDPFIAASADFAGLVGLEITGLSRSSGRHDIAALLTDGAALHPLRREHKEIRIRALALAKTECGLSYGFSWLASALRGGICGTGCVGDQFCFFTCCPPGCDPFLPPESPAQPPCCLPPPPPEEGPDPCGDLHFRTMFNVGLLTMENPSEIRNIPGGWLAQVEFTLVAGNPWIYQEPILVANAANAPPATVIPNYDPNVGADCEEAIDCLRDEDCPPPPAPILAPVPVDACFPTGTFTAARVVMNLPSGAVPIWAEKVPVIVVKAGTQRRNRLIFRFYGNPTERDCATMLDPCSACAELQIAFVPQGSTLVIDGRTETATVDCPGGPGLATAEPVLYGPAGAPFVWPVFNCSDGLCLEVIGEFDADVSGLEIEVFMAVREEAA
jgi:hypothetical protein